VLERGRPEEGRLSRGVPVSICSACGHAVFPARFLCPRCGGSEWQRTHVDVGVVEEATLVRRAPGGPLPSPIPVGSVRLRGGDVAVVARLEPEVEEGSSVRLDYLDGVPVAKPTTP
jgi:uncharacterized OB-fold protein